MTKNQKKVKKIKKNQKKDKMLFSTKTRDWLKLPTSVKTHLKPLLSVKSLVFTIYPRDPDFALQRQGYVLSCFMKLPGSVDHDIFNTIEEIPLCFKKAGIFDLLCAVDISDYPLIFSELQKLQKSKVWGRLILIINIIFYRSY